jgi:hypothetical protein
MANTDEEFLRSRILSLAGAQTLKISDIVAFLNTAWPDNRPWKVEEEGDRGLMVETLHPVPETARKMLADWMPVGCRLRFCLFTERHPRFAPGDEVMIYKPGHSEHGARGIVQRVMPIAEYGGPASSGPHAYRTVNGFRCPGDSFAIALTLPDYLVAAARPVAEIE